MTRVSYNITSRTGGTFTTTNYNEAMGFKASGYKVETKYTNIPKPVNMFYRGCKALPKSLYRPGMAI